MCNQPQNKKYELNNIGFHDMEENNVVSYLKKEARTVKSEIAGTVTCYLKIDMTCNTK
jgi:hypothetical protein